MIPMRNILAEFELRLVYKYVVLLNSIFHLSLFIHSHTCTCRLETTCFVGFIVCFFVCMFVYNVHEHTKFLPIHFDVFLSHRSVVSQYHTGPSTVFAHLALVIFLLSPVQEKSKKQVLLPRQYFFSHMFW